MAYTVEVLTEKCIGCGKCITVCPMEALALVSKNDIVKSKKIAKLTAENCIGCGVCVGVCKPEAIKMDERGKRVFTPVDMAHRVVLEAIETNKLQNLFFDNQAHFKHRALASIVGAILRLPPAKQILASKQVKSKYILRLIHKNNSKIVNKHVQ